MPELDFDPNANDNSASVNAPLGKLKMQDSEGANNFGDIDDSDFDYDDV